jgi:hypothetical protein
MVVEVAAVDPKPFAASQERFEELVEHLRSPESREMSHSDLERELEARGRELLRQLYQDHLELRAPGAVEGPVNGADGSERTQQRVHTRKLKTSFGPVEVSRMGYGAEGVESLHPLDAELNLPQEMYSHRVRERAAEEAAKNSFDEVVQSLEKTTGAGVPKRQVEQLVQRAAQDFNAFYQARQAEAAPAADTGSVLVISVDGKGVSMRPEDLREATRKVAEKRQHKLAKRLTKGEKRGAKRMATVAAVYTAPPFVRTPEDIIKELAPVRDTEKKRPRPENKRVWASLEKTPEEVIREALREATYRDEARNKTWVVLVDGNETQLRILGERSRQENLKLTVVLDVIHVLEYLWRAATAFNAEGSREAEAWVTERFEQILRGRASLVAAGIRRSATLRNLSTQQREPADVCADYLLKYSRYLRYDEYLAAGLPIASGVIEGACRHLIKDRMDLTGARWSLQGAEAVLRLRALRSSGDFEEYWRFHEKQEFERNHRSRYANGEPPSPKPPRRPAGTKPALRLVK